MMIHGLLRAVRPRHPLARLAIGVLGVLVVALFVSIGLFALIALTIGGGLLLLVNTLRSTSPQRASRSQPRASGVAGSPDIIEGEFKVVSATSAQRDPQTNSR